MEIKFFSHDGSPLEPKMNSYGIPARWVAKTQPRSNPEFWGTRFAADYLVVRRLSWSREHTCSYAAPSHIQGARGNATRICHLQHRRNLLFSKETISTVVVQTNTADMRTTASCAVVYTLLSVLIRVCHPSFGERQTKPPRLISPTALPGAIDKRNGSYSHRSACVASRLLAAARRQARPPC